MKLIEFSSNSLPVLMCLTGLLTFLIIFKEFYCYIRRTLRSNVQCWFCHHKTKVSYDEFNSWTCQKCDQYNGFSNDGGYNKILYNQFDSRLNPPVFGRACSRRPLNKNVLCYRCNANQQLKVQQLALFEPLEENNYDIEVDHFSAQLEKAYRLCEECEGLVSRVERQLREELGLPKRLMAALPPVRAGGEWCHWLNMAVCLLVVLVGLCQGLHHLRSFLPPLHHLRSFLPPLPLVDQLPVYPLIGAALLTSCLSLLQSRSFCTATISALLLLTSLYPDLHHVASLLQTGGGLVSLLVSGVYIHSRRRRRKGIDRSCPAPAPSLTKPQRCGGGKLSSGDRGLHEGLDSLQIGPRPLLAPPRFNPFSRPSYAAFPAPPPSYEPPSCYPCAASWSYCIYPRVNPPQREHSPCQHKDRDPLSFLIGIPITFLVLCNLALMNILYNTKISTNS